MTKIALFLSILFLFLSAQAQENDTLEQVRKDFQLIKGENDIEQLLEVEINESDPDAIRVQAYQAAGTCMMAEYVFSPIKKLKYFSEGKEWLESSIRKEKSVESVYCRLLIQLNVPRILNYHQDIEEDIAFLQAELPNAKIDIDYKNTMIRNLVTLTGKDELKQSLLGIDLTGEEKKS